MPFYDAMKMITISLLIILSFTEINFTQATRESETTKVLSEKELYIPAKVSRVPENNDYSDSASDYSFKRMVQGDNIAIFWHKEFGQDPANNPNEKKRFNPNEALRM